MKSFDMNQLSSKFDGFLDSSLHFGIKLLIAILIFVIGFWLAKKLTNSFRNLMIKKDIEPSLRTFLSSLINIILKGFVVIIGLATVGIEMTSIVAVLGAASLAVGMALSGTLQNFAGGVVILILKPFKVGDLIETASGHMGYVLSIMIFTTKMRTFDNRIIYLPNGPLANGVILNHMHESRRRVDLFFDISYGDDVQTARNVILAMLDKEADIHKEPAPLVRLRELNDSSIKIMARFWTDSKNYYRLRYEIREKVYNELPKHGLSFAFPQLDVHLEHTKPELVEK